MVLYLVTLDNYVTHILAPEADDTLAERVG